MPNEQFFHGQFAKILGKCQAVMAIIFLSFLVGMDLFFPTSYRIQAVIHGISAIAAVLCGTYLTHRVYPLMRGVHMNFISLKRWMLLAAILNFAGAVSGNWIYMRYRGQDGPRDWILGQAPVFHNVMMEFKEFISLFPFPLMIAASFIVFYYGEDIHERRDLTQLIGVMILLSWMFLMVGLSAGLVLAKLRFV